MKIEILEYQIIKGNKVKVQSHNYRKGKWKPNPKWDWHVKVASGTTMLMHGIQKGSVKKYTKEIK